MKKNCWQVMSCGREVGGERSEALGVCAAATESRVDGTNHGHNAGRACWTISGTLCGGEVQGTYARKLAQCLNCDFYTLVKEEEGGEYVYSRQIVPLLVA